MSELEPTRTYSNPTATELLRRMLDERGVEWESKDVEGISGFHDTRWNAYGVRWCYTEFVGKNYTKLIPSKEFHCTPEQAIAATLGSTTRADRLLAELNNDRRINKQLKMANALLRKSEAEKIERIKALESLVLDWAMAPCAPCAVCDPWDEYFACEHFDGGDCTLGIRMAELGLGLEVGE